MAPPAQQSFAVGGAGAISASASFTPVSLAAGARGTITITFTNPNAMSSPPLTAVLTSPSLVPRATSAAAGTCLIESAKDTTSITVGLSNVVVPSGTCTITLDYTGVTPGSASGFALSVATPNGFAPTSATGSNSFVVVPTITSISPDTGPVSQVVTISGTGFSSAPGNNTVSFGSAGAGTVTVANATSLTVTAPATGSGAAGRIVTLGDSQPNCGDTGSTPLRAGRATLQSLMTARARRLTCRTP